MINLGFVPNFKMQRSTSLWLSNSFVTDSKRYRWFSSESYFFHDMARVYLSMPFSFISKRMNEVFFLSAISKKLKRAAYISKCESIFKCPICSSPMKLWECKSLVCTHHSHTFDLTKQGYVNFLKKPVKSRYGTELFEARRKLMSENDFSLLFFRR